MYTVLSLMASNAAEVAQQENLTVTMSLGCMTCED